jgi:hypothetical protein
MNRFVFSLSGICLSFFACAASVDATTVPFTENFLADVANWTNFNGTALLSFNDSGGPDDSSYASGDYNFKDLAFGDQGPVILRASPTPLGAASAGNLFGDWIADGVTSFSAQVRHNASVPLTFFARFASPFNFPGGTAIRFAPVLPNIWTDLKFDIHPSNPAFVTFEGETFTDVFDGVGNIQIGVSVPQALAGLDRSFVFDVDQVSIVPEPSSWVITGLAVLACFSRRHI